MVKRILFQGLLILFMINQLSGQSSIKKIIGPEINGIKQRLIIEGKDDTKPLLLFLHGGPGFGSVGYAKKFAKELRKDFIIVQWDQRNTGATKVWNDDNTPLSLELMHQDTKATIDYVLKEFNRKKLYLVGFSWGSFLGIHYAKNHSQSLHAYVSVSGLVDGNNSEKQILMDLKSSAEKENNVAALAEINTISVPFENGEDLYLQRKWTAEFYPQTMQNTKLKKSMVEDWSETWLPIFNEAAKIDYGINAPQFDCPIYFFHSPQDRVSHFAIAREYYDIIKAPKKEWIDFPGAPHEIVSAQPKEFSQAIKSIAEKVVAAYKD